MQHIIAYIDADQRRGLVRHNNYVRTLDADCGGLQEPGQDPSQGRPSPTAWRRFWVPFQPRAECTPFIEWFAGDSKTTQDSEESFDSINADSNISR